MKKNKEVKIIMQVTKLGDQFCSTIVETKSDILTENEVIANYGQRYDR